MDETDEYLEELDHNAILEYLYDLSVQECTWSYVLVEVYLGETFFLEAFEIHGQVLLGSEADF